MTYKMMNKEWYVLHQAQKYGPFAQKQILEMLKTGSMMRSQKIWREGMPQPITCYDLFLGSMKVNQSNQSLQQNTDVVASQPSINNITKIERRVEPVAQSEQQDDFDDMPPPLPPIPSSKPVIKISAKAKPKQKENEILREVSNFKQISGVQDQALPPLPPDIIRKESAKKRKGKFFKHSLIAAFGFIFSIILYFICHDLYYVKFNKASRPRFVDIKDYRLLSRVQKKNIAQNTVAILTSKDSESLVLSTNFIYDANLEIELISQESRVLSNEKIQLKSEARLSSGLAHFSELEFLKGNKILPGYYNVKLRSNKEKRELYWYDKWFPTPQKLVMEDLSIFLGHLPLKIYKKKMQRFLRKRNRKEKQFLGDLQQKWLTLEGIVKQLKQELLTLLEVPSQVWKLKTRAFETKYTKVYGSFFTEFYLNNQQVQKQLKKSDIRELKGYDSQYKRLSRIAQAVGKKTVEIIERSSAFNFAPNTEARANITSTVLKNTDGFLDNIKKGQLFFKDLEVSVENEPASESED